MKLSVVGNNNIRSYTFHREEAIPRTTRQQWLLDNMAILYKFVSHTVVYGKVQKLRSGYANKKFTKIFNAGSFPDAFFLACGMHTEGAKFL